MDILKIGSRFTLGLIEKIAEKAIQKNLGYNAKVSLDNAEAFINENEACLKVSLELKIPKTDLAQFVQKLILHG